MIPKSCRLFRWDHAQGHGTARSRKDTNASDGIMREIEETRPDSVELAHAKARNPGPGAGGRTAALHFETKGALFPPACPGYTPRNIAMTAAGP